MSTYKAIFLSTYLWMSTIEEGTGILLNLADEILGTFFRNQEGPFFYIYTLGMLLRMFLTWLNSRS